MQASGASESQGGARLECEVVDLWTCGTVW